MSVVSFALAVVFIITDTIFKNHDNSVYIGNLHITSV